MKKRTLPSNLREFLDSRVEKYNSPSFIAEDPISIPHLFSDPENIAISAFLTAAISWGQRPQIIKSASYLMKLMDNDPLDFIRNSDEEDILQLQKFYYRTFNGIDCVCFIHCLKNIYGSGLTLQKIFESEYLSTGNMKGSLIGFRQHFFKDIEAGRSAKHLSDPSKGSGAKRLNMFLRWMVRSDNKGVDFGLWRGIPMTALYIPLDVHTGNTARQLGLLKRTANDWQSVEELTAVLRTLDANDPVKYDFALFGTGIFEKE